MWLNNYVNRRPAMTINFKDFKLLVVDDDEDLRETLYDFFAEKGANVFLACDGEKALQVTLMEKIDLILSDIKMPVMDGLELLKIINGYENNTPLVWLMSGQCDLNEKSALDLGAEGLLNKPFKLQFVLEKITQSLKKIISSRKHC